MFILYHESGGLTQQAWIRSICTFFQDNCTCSVHQQISHSKLGHMMTTEPSPWQLSKLYPLMNILRYPGKDSMCTLGLDRFVFFISQLIKPRCATCFPSKPVVHKSSLPWAPWRWNCDDRDWTELTSWWSDYGRSDSGLWDPRSARQINRLKRSIYLFPSLWLKHLYFRDDCLRWQLWNFFSFQSYTLCTHMKLEVMTVNGWPAVSDRHWSLFQTLTKVLSKTFLLCCHVNV